MKALVNVGDIAKVLKGWLKKLTVVCLEVTDKIELIGVGLGGMVIVAVIPGEVLEPGKVWLDPKDLNMGVKASKGYLKLESTDKTLIFGRAVLPLKVMTEEPDLSVRSKNVYERVWVTGDRLLGSISRVSHASGKDEGRPNLMGIWLEVDEWFSMTTTDGHRLSRSSSKNMNQVMNVRDSSSGIFFKTGLLIPLFVAEGLQKTLKGFADVELGLIDICRDNAILAVSFGSFKVYVNIHAEKFPTWCRVVPERDKMTRVVMGTDVFRDAVKSCLAMTGVNSFGNKLLELNVSEKGNLEIGSHPIYGDEVCGSTECGCSIHGIVSMTEKLCVNGEYLLDALKNVGGKTLELWFEGSFSAIAVIENDATDDKGHMAVFSLVMPTRN